MLHYRDDRAISIHCFVKMADHFIVWVESEGGKMLPCSGGADPEGEGGAGISVTSTNPPTRPLKFWPSTFSAATVQLNKSVYHLVSRLG